ncbi:hypothetical protein [uncultured Psychrosphaera sp.]|uniref:hypothetical protein n=1 Tax=uncultured Psychrosphaera sp. TaxID=1403522 RepID=UPI0026139929|nr:hypothetical protein [uncultured Psychrosphaera sp.]
MIEFEELLIDMGKYGIPTLMMYSGEWSCTNELNNKIEGANLEIRTDDFNTPSEAVKQCHERTMKAIKVLP